MKTYLRHMLLNAAWVRVSIEDAIPYWHSGSCIYCKTVKVIIIDDNMDDYPDVDSSRLRSAIHNICPKCKKSFEGNV